MTMNTTYLDFMTMSRLHHDDEMTRNYARLWPDEADGEPSKKEEEAEVEEEENAHGGAEAEEHFAMPDLFD